MAPNVMIQSHHTWMAEGFVNFNRLRGELPTIVDPYILEKVSGAVLSLPGLC